MIRLGTAVVAGVVVVTTAIPAEKAQSRELFEGLFNRRSESRAVDRSSQDRSGFWSIFSNRRSPVEVVIEPEKPYIPPVYQADILAPLLSADISNDRPSDVFAGAIYDQLTAGGDQVVRVHPSHKKPIIEFYQARGFKPLWTSENGVNLRAERMLKLLQKADLEGLRPVDYLPEALGSFKPDERPELSGPADNALLDIELTVAAVKYAHHASAGRIVPSRLSKYIDLNPEPVAADVVLQALSRTVRPDTYLAGLHPSHEIYTNFKRELTKHREIARRQSDITVPSGGLLKLNVSDDRVPLLRKKLRSLGLLEPRITEIAVDFEARRDFAPLGPLPRTTTSAVSTVYDKYVVAAVKQFQKSEGLSTDGVVGPATIRVMNRDTFSERIEKLVLNMERSRWLPKDLGRRHVLVNQAAYELKLFDEGEIIHRARVIVGKYNHQTPAFSDEMEFVVLNPYWNVPSSIATKEMLPHLLADPSYLDRKGFEVVGRTGQVSSSSVYWEDYEGSKLPFNFRQPPGPGNALGAMKFMFPNRHNVYMHDTPTKHLFSRRNRTFSHGCVRVQHADQFASVILEREGWTPNRIRNAVRVGENRKIVLKKKVSVHITYFTAWAESTEIVFYQDMYGRDKLLKRALGHNLVAMK